MSCTWSRPWVIPTMFSLRVSTQRTGRPVWRAAHATATTSRSTPILAPNPPPTSGAITRIAAWSRSSAPARMTRASWAFCVLAHTVSFPSRQSAAAVRTSSGTAASRWLMIVRVTTTSQPVNTESSNAGPPSVRAPPVAATFVPAGGNSRVSSASAAAVPTTAGSGS